MWTVIISSSWDLFFLVIHCVKVIPCIVRIWRIAHRRLVRRIWRALVRMSSTRGPSTGGSCSIHRNTVASYGQRRLPARFRATGTTRNRC